MIQQIPSIRSKDDIKRTIFLDKTIGKCFPVEMLEAWLQFLDNYPESKEVETEFMDSKAWYLLTRETLGKMRENLIDTYQKYVGKFIQWANEQDKLDLSKNTPLELINGLKKIRKKKWVILDEEKFTDRAIKESQRVINNKHQNNSNIVTFYLPNYDIISE